MFKARKVSTKRYTERVVEETMNGLPMDIAWVLQSIISATNTEDVSNVVDAFVTGVKAVTERNSRSDLDVSLQERVNQGITQNETEVSVKESADNVEISMQSDVENGGCNDGDIDSDLCDARVIEDSKKSREIIEQYKGAKAIIEGMTGGPELVKNIKESVLDFGFDTSDVHSIMYLGTTEYLTPESKAKVFRNASGAELVKVVDRYNAIIAEKLEGATANVTLGTRNLVVVIHGDGKFIDGWRVIYEKDRIKSFADYVRVLCDCARLYNVVDYVVYSTGNNLKLKGICPEGYVNMTLRIICYSKFSSEEVIKCAESTLRTVTCQVKLPRIEDALK